MNAHETLRYDRWTHRADVSALVDTAVKTSLRYPYRDIVVTVRRPTEDEGCWCLVNFHGLPCGECPVCGTFWTPSQANNGTGYGIIGISREDYQRWMAANGYGTNPPALHRLPNVVTRTAPIQAETPFQQALIDKGLMR